MTTTTQVPPERCPVCGALWEIESAGRRAYECGASWYFDGTWNNPCPHAMTAALRTGATLLPSPLEQATQRLCAAAVEVHHAQENWDNGFSASETTSETIEDLHNAFTTAFNNLRDATAAYLALSLARARKVLK